MGIAPPAQRTSTRIFCVYAVVSGFTGPLRATGIAGEKLRRVKLASLDMVVATLPRAPRPHTAVLRRYDQAIQVLALTHASVLPARFGTCVSSLDELAVRLQDRRDRLKRSLRLVRHRVQMTIRVFHSDSVQSLSGPGSEPVRSRFGVGSESGDKSTQGTEFLRRRAREQRVPGVEPLRDAVRRWVKAERMERHNTGRLAGSVFHLIPRSAVPAYQRALERASLDAGLTTIVSGPWPAYAFVDGW